MKQSKSFTKPLNAQQFPLQAQTDATAGRDKVRENVPVHAPRQSKFFRDWPALWTIIVATLIATAAQAAPQPQYRLTILWEACKGSEECEATAINNRGTVVGNRHIPEITAGRAFVYQNRRVLSLAMASDSASFAYAINDRDEIAMTIGRPDRPNEAALYSRGMRTYLGSLGGGDSYAWGVNDSGVVVGQSFDVDGRPRAFVYRDGRMSPILADPAGEAAGDAHGVNDRGQTTGEIRPNAFIHDDSGLTFLGTLGGAQSEGLAINNAGHTTGWSTRPDGLVHAFRYSNGVMRDLGSLGTSPDGLSYSVGYAINRKGQVVGESRLRPGDDDQQRRAFIYTGGKMHDLNRLTRGLGYFRLEIANGINDAGQIVGHARRYGPYGGVGLPRAFLLTPMDSSAP
jgi:probable HAF family extracellular repeat protein